MRSGIYWIRNRITGKFYIGSSADVRRRLIHHRCYLKAGTHHNEHLQNAYRKYGREAFQFQTIENVPPSELLPAEQWYLDHTRCLDRAYGYNIDPVASHAGCDDATAAKISLSMKAAVADPVNRERLRLAGLKGSVAASKANTGKRPSAETLEKLSASRRAYWSSPAGRARRETMGEAISRQKLGRKNPRKRPPAP